MITIEEVWGKNYFIPIVTCQSISLRELTLLALIEDEGVSLSDLHKEIYNNVQYLYVFDHCLRKVSATLYSLKAKGLVRKKDKWFLTDKGKMLKKISQIMLKRCIDYIKETGKKEASLGTKTLEYLTLLSLGIAERRIPINRAVKRSIKSKLVKLELATFRYGEPYPTEIGKELSRILCETGIGNPFFMPPVPYKLTTSDLNNLEHSLNRYFCNILKKKALQIRNAIIIYENKLITLNGSYLQLAYINKVIDRITNVLHNLHIEYATLNLSGFKDEKLEPAFSYGINYDLIILIGSPRILIRQKFYDLYRKLSPNSYVLRIYKINSRIIKALNIDYNYIDRTCSTFKKMISSSKIAIVENLDGTKLVLDIHNCKVHSVSGIMDDKNRFSRLPAGEVYLAPRNCNGLIVLGRFSKISGIKENLSAKIPINDSRIELKNINNVFIKKFLQSVKNYSPIMMNVAELGIGLNPMIDLKELYDVDPLLCSIALGQIHIGFGFNEPIGGVIRGSKQEYWLISIQKPTLILDDKLVIKRGKFIIPNFEKVAS